MVSIRLVWKLLENDFLLEQSLNFYQTFLNAWDCGKKLHYVNKRLKGQYWTCDIILYQLRKWCFNSICTKMQFYSWIPFCCCFTGFNKILFTYMSDWPFFLFTQKHQVHLFEALRKIMWDLVKCRQDLLSGTLTQVCISSYVLVTGISWLPRIFLNV